MFQKVWKNAEKLKKYEQVEMQRAVKVTVKWAKASLLHSLKLKLFLNG